MSPLAAIKALLRHLPEQNDKRYYWRRVINGYQSNLETMRVHLEFERAHGDHELAQKYEVRIAQIKDFLINLPRELTNLE